MSAHEQTVWILKIGIKRGGFGTFISSESKMDKTIREIYQKLISDMIGEDEISRVMKDEILSILNENGKEETTGCGYCKDQVFRAASAAEEAGFVRGFKYAFLLVLEILT